MQREMICVERGLSVSCRGKEVGFLWSRSAIIMQIYSYKGRKDLREIALRYGQECSRICVISVG